MHRCAALCKSSSIGRAGCPGSNFCNEQSVVLTMIVNSSFRSCAAAAATAQARSAFESLSTPESYRLRPAHKRRQEV